MKLYSKLQEQTSMPSEHKFAYAVLKRLSIIEACAALQHKSAGFVNMDESRLQRSIQETCVSLGKKTEQTKLFLDIFKEIEALAGLISSSCSAQWSTTELAKLKKIGLESARTILPKFKDNQIVDAITTYVHTQSLKIVEQLDSDKCVNQSAIIKQTIIDCWPRIDMRALEHVIANIDRQTQALHTTFKEDSEWVDLAVCSMFKPETQRAPEPPVKSICSIS